MNNYQASYLVCIRLIFVFLNKFSEAATKEKFVKTDVVNVLAESLKSTYKFNFVSKLAGRMFLRTNFFIDTTLLTIQRWMNVVSTLQITVQITVIRR